MPKITALIHAHHDADRLGRALDSLRPCDEVIIISHVADPAIEKVARTHGATFKTGVFGVAPGAYLVDARHDWILSLLPCEAISEGLEAALLEWKQSDHEPNVTYAMRLREQTNAGWVNRDPETRLANRNGVNWTSELPPHDPGSQLIEGEILRFSNP